MKRNLFISIFFICFSISVKSQHPFREHAPREIENKFDSIYPFAKDVWWTCIDSSQGKYYYTAHFIDNGDDVDLYFKLEKGQPLQLDRFVLDGFHPIPDYLKHKFDSIFPNARHTFWHTIPLHYDTLKSLHVSFYFNPNQTSQSDVEFDFKGKIISLTLFCTKDMIPKSITDFLTKKYSGYTQRSDIIKSQNTHHALEYYVVLYKGQKRPLDGKIKFTCLVFNRNGKYLRRFKYTKVLGGEPEF